MSILTEDAAVWDRYRISLFLASGGRIVFGLAEFFNVRVVGKSPRTHTNAAVLILGRPAREIRKYEPNPRRIESRTSSTPKVSIKIDRAFRAT